MAAENKTILKKSVSNPGSYNEYENKNIVQNVGFCSLTDFKFKVDFCNLSNNKIINAVTFISKT